MLRQAKPRMLHPASAKSHRRAPRRHPGLVAAAMAFVHATGWADLDQEQAAEAAEAMAEEASPRI